MDSEAAKLAIFQRSYQTSILHWMYEMPLEEELTVLLILPPNSEEETLRMLLSTETY